jgi:hypothetical protein
MNPLSETWKKNASFFVSFKKIQKEKVEVKMTSLHMHLMRIYLVTCFLALNLWPGGDQDITAILPER